MQEMLHGVWYQCRRLRGVMLERKVRIANREVELRVFY